jgi:hypothetical protein
MRSFIPVEQLNNYVPNRPGAVEIVYQPFYDFQAYAAGGATQMLFFQVPAGQGGKTFGDTNMTLAGQFPSPTTFVIDDIQVYLNPGAVVALSAAAARALTNWNDVVAVLNAGPGGAAQTGSSWLELSVGSKTIFRDAPLNKFPVNFTVAGTAAIGFTNAAAANQTDVSFARGVGKVYSVIPIAIPQNQNFQVSLNWAVAVAATANGRIGVLLNGNYYRLSQ